MFARLALAAVLLGALPAFADDAICESDPGVEPELTDANQSCLDCHQDREGTLRLSGGDTLPLFVDEQELFASVHGEKLLCTDCHRTAGEIPHPPQLARTHREFTLGESARCRRCHFLNFARTRESVHTGVKAGSSARAPACVDCHGAHGMQPPQRPRVAISRRCGACHREQFDVYARSVHGKALFDEGSEDVPVCTDCHRAHDIADPRGDEFARLVPAMCGRCHGDAERMGRYHLSTEVQGSYLSDFHGATTSRILERGEPGRVVAVCTDCHGVHDIESTRDRGLAPVRARLQKSCDKCHKDAPVTFPDAWLPHYEASLGKAPLMIAVKGFRWIFIPLVAGGLLLQIGLHIYRIAANRW